MDIGLLPCLSISHSNLEARNAFWYCYGRLHLYYDQARDSGLLEEPKGRKCPPMLLFDKGYEWDILPVHLQSYAAGLLEEHLIDWRLVSEVRHILIGLSTEPKVGGKQHGFYSEVYMPWLWCR